MNNENKEYRKFEVRAEGEGSRHISGYALVWESDSKDMGFIERIDRGAIAQDLVNNSDVICNYNHEDMQILARWVRGSGTLNITIDDHGLKYDFEAPDTQLGNDLLFHVRNGNIFESSFCFTIDPDDEGAQTWSRDSDGTIRRTIHRINGLFDVALCPHGAYAATSVVARKLQELQEPDKMDLIMSEIDDLCK